MEKPRGRIRTTVEWIVLLAITIIIERYLSDALAIAVIIGGGFWLLGITPGVRKVSAQYALISSIVAGLILGVVGGFGWWWLVARPSVVARAPQPPSGEAPSQPQAKPEPNNAEPHHAPVVPKPTEHQAKVSEPSQIVSPDPYVGTPDEKVATWAHQEADTLEKLAEQSSRDYIEAERRKANGIPINPAQGFYGTEYIQVNFVNEFNSRHTEAIAKLHESLTFRLGPDATKSEEVEYQRLLHSLAMANQDPRNWGWELFGDAKIYSEDLRAMATKMRH